MSLLIKVSMLYVFLINTAIAAPTNRVFVSNERGDSISVIDGETLEIETTIEVGKRPRGLALSHDGLKLYVAVSEEDKIKVIETETLKIIKEFEAGSDPETFAVHPNGYLYVSNEDDAKATVFDPETGKKIIEIPVGLEPEGVTISKNGKYVIVTSESSNMLHVIKTPENKIEKNILVGSRPRATVFNKAADTIYATAEISGEVFKIDVKSGEILKARTIGDDHPKPKDVILSKDESHLYIAGGRANVVVLLNANTLEIVKRIPVGKRVWGLAISKDGKQVFSTNGVSNTVSVIDTEKNEVIKNITVGKMPWGVVIND